jgi:hypothetical protein
VLLKYGGEENNQNERVGGELKLKLHIVFIGE